MKQFPSEGIPTWPVVSRAPSTVTGGRLTPCWVKRSSLMSEPSLPELESRRAGLFARLAVIGDFRRGTVTENYRRCGKRNCACAQPGHPGHGPRWLWTRTVAGRGTRGRQLAAGEVEKVRREVDRYQEFAALTEQIVQVSEAICEARPVQPEAGRRGPAAEGLDQLRAQIAAEFAAEVGRLAAAAVRSLAGDSGGAGLEAAELAIRAAMTTVGASLLAGLLAGDAGYRGPRIPCGRNRHLHPARPRCQRAVGGDLAASQQPDAPP